MSTPLKCRASFISVCVFDSEVSLHTCNISMVSALSTVPCLPARVKRIIILCALSRAQRE